MEVYQIHFGRKFYQDKKSGYWISTDNPRIRANNFVWLKHNGFPPKNTHVHHLDGDKSNNSIRNLQLGNGRSHHSTKCNPYKSPM